MNHHLIMVERSECRNDPRSLLLLGAVCPRQFGLWWGARQNTFLEDPYDDWYQGFGHPAWRGTAALPWSQAWERGSQASAWWLGPCTWDPAGLSPKGEICNHPPVSPPSSGAETGIRWYVDRVAFQGRLLKLATGTWLGRNLSLYGRL